MWDEVERAVRAHRTVRERYLTELLKLVPVLSYTEQTAYQRARIWADLESRGKRTGYYDLIVAATAIERGSKVVTFNKKHFTDVTGLTVIDPRE